MRMWRCSLRDALKRNQDAFHAKQPRARAVYDCSMAVDEDHQQNQTYSQMFDLPREDMDITPEAFQVMLVSGVRRSLGSLIRGALRCLRWQWRKLRAVSTPMHRCFVSCC